MTKTTDVLIIGGGAIGCSIAYQLSKAKIKTIIAEKAERVGSEASWASAGMLSVRSLAPNPFATLSKSSFDMYQHLPQELKEISQIDVECLSSGALELIFSEEDEKSAKGYYQRQKAQGMEVEFLQPEEVWKVEPAISKEIRGAFLYPKDRQVRNTKFVVALAKAANMLGAEILTRNPVVDVIKEGHRLIGVETPSYTIHCGHLVIAAGCWSNQIGSLFGLKIPVEPARGQMLLSESMPHLIQHMIHAEDIYLVPRADGKILIGSTVEFVGYDKRVTLSGIWSLMEKGLKICPQLGDKTLTKTWAGLRPYSKARHPLIGFIPEIERTIIASGHFRNGILLAPITGKLVKELVLGETTSVPTEAFQIK